MWGPKSVFHAQQLSLSWREQIIKLGREFIVRIDLENQTRFSMVNAGMLAETIKQRPTDMPYLDTIENLV